MVWNFIFISTVWLSQMMSAKFLSWVRGKKRPFIDFLELHFSVATYTSLLLLSDITVVVSLQAS